MQCSAPCNPSRTFDPLPVGIVLLGRRLVVEVFHEHVKQQFDLMIIHGQTSPRADLNIIPDLRLLGSGRTV